MRSIRDFLKKKEALLHQKEPVLHDAYDFLSHKHPVLSQSVTPFAYSRGMLHVRMISSAALQEFFLVKPQLLAHLKLKNHPIRDIKTHL